MCPCSLVPAGISAEANRIEAWLLLDCSCLPPRVNTVPAGIRAEVDKLDKALRLFSSTLEAWLECQKNWLFLESIFSASDIQRQLPAESKAFLQVELLRVWPAPARILAYTPWIGYFWHCSGETLICIGLNFIRGRAV